MTAPTAASTPAPIPFIDLKAQYKLIEPQIQARIKKVLDHGQYIMGPEVAEMEAELAAYVGAKHCISCASGTDSLLMAMMVYGIGPGDEVITTPFTFIATGEMIALLGATPVFVDIDPRTYNIDPAKIEAAITGNTKAIMPVSLYGQCAEMDAINAIAAKHRLPVIEDAAQSFGATYKGRKSCAVSTIGSTSFFPSKPLGAYGDGGALFTDDDAIATTLRQIRLHGQDRHYHHTVVGINGRMDTIQCAVVSEKFTLFPGEVEARQRVASSYAAALADAVKKGVVTPYIEPHNLSVFAQYTLLVPDRAKVQAALKEQGIPTAVHYPIPLHLQPVFKDLGLSEGAFPVAEDIARRVVSLPMSPYLSDEHIQRIAAAVTSAL